MMTFFRSSPVVLPVRLSLLGAVCLAGLGGCSSAPTSYYALSPREGAAVAPLAAMALPSVIEVRIPSVTARLDRDGILEGMRQSEDHMLPATEWSEPLGEMVGHTLVADLSRRLPGHVLFSQNESVAVIPGAYLELSLTRFEQDASGHALIAGILSAHRAGADDGQARAVPVQWVSPQPVPGGAAGLVHALDDGVAALADQAIPLLASLPALPSAQ